MSDVILSDVARVLGLAIFQRDKQGRLRLAGPAPEWLTALWPAAAGPGGVLRPAASPFLENFLVDAAAAWATGGARRVNSGLWAEQDARGGEHHLQATAFTAGGRASLLVEGLGPAYEERKAIMQKAHEAALAFEKLQRTEKALAEGRQRLEQQYRRQAALAEIELAINQPHELQRVLDRIAEVVTQLLPATAASVVLWDAPAGQFALSASTVRRQPRQLTRRRVRRRHGATSWIIEHRRPRIVPDVAADPFGANSMLREFRLRAYAGFPLLVEGKALGVVYALDDRPREYPPSDQDFLQALAGRAAVAIAKVQFSEQLQSANRRLARQADELAEKNARLAGSRAELEQRVRERTADLSEANAALTEEIAARQRYAERLQGMRDIDKAILIAQSPEAIAEVALRRLRRLLPCDYASVVELDPERERGAILARLERGRVARGGERRLSSAQLAKALVLKSGRLHRVRRQPNLFGMPARGGRRPRLWPLILDVPLRAGDTLIGVLNLATRSPLAFTTEHEEIAREVAMELAVAIRQARLFAQLSAGREQLRALSLRLVEVQEAERRFIAHELHDEIGQELTGLKLTLEMAGNGSAGGAEAGVGEAIGMVDELMKRVRQLSLDLRPQMLDDLGLLHALDWLFKRHLRQTGVRVEFKRTAWRRRLPAHLETAVFRIVQEALTNVARHAGLKEATVRLWLRGGSVGVQVEDGGRGFDVERALAARASNGVAGMRERAELLGGAFTLDSAPGAGTRLTVELPLP